MIWLECFFRYFNLQENSQLQLLPSRPFQTLATKTPGWPSKSWIRSKTTKSKKFHLNLTSISIYFRSSKCAPHLCGKISRSTNWQLLRSHTQMMIHCVWYGLYGESTEPGSDLDSLMKMDNLRHERLRFPRWSQTKTAMPAAIEPSPRCHSGDWYPEIS